MLSRTSFDLPGAGSLIFPAYLVSAHHNARRSVNSEYTVISMETYNTHTHTPHQLGLRGFRPPFSSVGRKIQAWGTRNTLVLPLARKRQGAYNNTSRKTRKRVGLVPACRVSLCCRFDVSGVHPQNKMPGTYTEVPYCKKATSKEVSSTRTFNKHTIYKFHCRIDCWGPVRTASTLATSASEQCGVRREVPTGNGPFSWRGSRRYLTRSSVESGSRGST